MKIAINKILFKKCYITPFENLEGVIVGLNQSRKGTELQIRYFLNGEYRTEWFYDFDVEVLDD